MCSPRVRHLEYVISRGAQDSRAIFTVKEESLARLGFHRLQLLSSESVRCETSERLRFAPVAMHLRIAAAGLDPGEAMRLAHPMSAINAFARDPTGKATAELESGRKATALEIQRHYLEIAESCLSERWMPAWAEAECARWRWVLDALSDNAQSLVGRLDWPTKRFLYSAYCERHGIRWESLPRWSSALRELFPRARASKGNKFKSARTTPRIESMLAKRGGNRSRVAEVLHRHDLNRSDLPSFIDLRDKLFETDIRFGEIGPDSLFARLQNEGLIAAGKIGTDEVEYARNNAPPDTRAQVRATWIRKQHTKLAQQKVDSTKTRRVPRLVSSRRRLSRMSRFVSRTSSTECNWDRIRDHERNMEVRIDDPFQAECGDWEPMKRVRERSIVDREPALGAIVQAIDAGRPRQALARILSLITEQD